MSRYLLLLLISIIFATTGSAQQRYLAPVYENRILKMIDTSGNIVVDSIDYLEVYDYMDFKRLEQVSDFFVDGVFRVQHSGHFGYKHYTGRAITPCIFSNNTHCFKNGFAAVCSNNKWGLINKQGQYVADTIYDYVSDVTPDGVFVVREADDIAIMDTSGKYIVPFNYKTSISLGFPEPEFADGLLRVMVPDNSIKGLDADLCWKIGYINTRGRLIIDTIYTLNGALGNTGADYGQAVNSGAICGTTLQAHRNAPRSFHSYLNKTYYKFEGGLCLVTKDNVPTVIDTKGKTVFTSAPAIASINIRNGIIIVTKKSGKFISPGSPGFRRGPDENEIMEYGAYNRNGRLIIPFRENQSISLLYDTLIAETTAVKPPVANDYVVHMEILDTNGRPRFKYYSRPMAGGEFYKGISRSAKLSLGEKEWGAITFKGQYIPYAKNASFESVSEWNWVIGITWDGKWGFWDGNSKWALPAIYEEAQPFENGYAWVKKDNKWAFINRHGELKLPYRYDFAMPFRLIDK